MPSSQPFEDDLETIRGHVKSILGTSGSHGMDHTERVVAMCRRIGVREKADLRILLSAALLHDIARPLEKEYGTPHEAQGAIMAQEYLTSLGWDAAIVREVCSAIRTHRFRSDEKPVSLEAKILSDADKLDALGAVGIARTFMRAAEHGGEIEDAVFHFHDKLLKLKDLMYTDAAREIAHRRHAFLLSFAQTLEQELKPAHEMIP
jgi:uncharacterized protein